jgi:hypothetical protein
MPDFKEPRYFASDLPSRFREPRASGLPAETYEDYLALFAEAAPGQRVGEASTAYIWSHEAPAQIARARPDARIIALFREPASFLTSLHLQLRQIRIESASTLREALALEDARRAGRELPPEMVDWPRVLLYRERVRYVEQLRRLHQAFGAEQVLVLVYEDFRSDNEQTVKRVLGFLGVDETVPVSASEANPSVRMRSRAVDDVVRNVTTGGGPLVRNVRRAAKAVLPGDTREGLRRLLWRGVVFGSPKPPDEELTRELRREFRDEVEAFGEYLGRDLLGLWGYDHRR